MGVFDIILARLGDGLIGLSVCAEKETTRWFAADGLALA